jgi:hydrogenase maturation protease
MTTAILCLGNEIIGDDGVGIRVGRVLASLDLPANVEVILRPNVGLDLIELLEEHEAIILVDAMTSQRPAGTCEVLELAAAKQMANCPSCSHSIGIPQILQLANHMFPKRALSTIRIVGIEASSLDTFGVGLSPVVQQALPNAVDAVLELVNASSSTRSKAKGLAMAEARATPSLAEVLGARG